MMAWIFEADLPASVPFGQVHVALYAYFPQIGHGESRPYVYRYLSPGRVAVLSALRPSAPAAREVRAHRGQTLQFRLTWNRVRNVRGSYTRPDGSYRKRVPRAAVIADPEELKARVAKFAAARGGLVRYIRCERPRILQVPGRFEVPIVDSEGMVYVDDEVAFDRLLCLGGPGTSKAFGCGLWWLPELMAAPAAVRSVA